MYQVITSSVSVAQAATIINALVTIVQWTFPLLLVAILIHLMPKANTALAWSSISRTLHSSLWPTLLSADTSSTGKGFVVAAATCLTTLVTVLIAVSGVVAPLGLHTGPLYLSEFSQIPARYTSDGSPLALATTPNRENFTYGRHCGFLNNSTCPGNNSPNDTAIPPRIKEIFNSTPHGPFAIQYRQFFNEQRAGNMSGGFIGTAETLVLRNDTFVTGGLVLDMASDHPGIGFLNQTIPIMQGGGTWSQDILWLEPVTMCVDTNLTIDYFLKDGLELGIPFDISEFNLTDRGGFANLATETPLDAANGQQLDLFQHAYIGAVASNLFTVRGLNTTQEKSSIGKAYPINDKNGGASLSLVAGKIASFELNYFHLSFINSGAEINVNCSGFGGHDNTNISNVHISCGMMLGPPFRTDYGDNRIFNPGSKWSQGLYSCSSATRASIQTTTFSANTSSELQNPRVSRRLSNQTFVWATEKTDMKIGEITPLWGRVTEKYEDEPSLWTLRSDYFFLPAGRTSIIHLGLLEGGPQTAHAVIWSWVHEAPDIEVSDRLADYSGQTDFAMKVKFLSLVQKRGVEVGSSQILNLVWTDIMANHLVGTQADSTLLVAQNLRSIDYDFRFAIPGFVLLVIWMPSFLGALFVLGFGMITLKYTKGVLNHLSVGRVVVGSSELRVLGRSNEVADGPEQESHESTNSLDVFPQGRVSVELDIGRELQGHRRGESGWAFTGGRSRVALELD